VSAISTSPPEKHLFFKPEIEKLLESKERMSVPFRRLFFHTIESSLLSSSVSSVQFAEESFKFAQVPFHKWPDPVVYFKEVVQLGPVILQLEIVPLEMAKAHEFVKELIRILPYDPRPYAVDVKRHLIQEVGVPSLSAQGVLEKLGDPKKQGLDGGVEVVE
jgi:hypothetical protein